MVCYCNVNKPHLFSLTKHKFEHFLLTTDAHNVKKVELLKLSKINKNAPTCFGLHVNHLQLVKVSTWLKVTRLVCIYAAIALTTPCTSFTHLLLTKCVTLSQVLTLAP